MFASYLPFCNEQATSFSLGQLGVPGAPCMQKKSALQLHFWPYNIHYYCSYRLWAPSGDLIGYACRGRALRGRSLARQLSRQPR